MPSLKGSETEQNLKDALADESQASRRYLSFAGRADIEGLNDVAAVFRSTAADIYPSMARIARREGFDEIAAWLETLAKAGMSHAGRFRKPLDAL